jgi:4-carboxymuconolactone decarboxylase
MSRIPYLTAEELSDEQRRLAAKLAASRGGRLVGPGAFWLRNPALAEQADAWRLLMEWGTALPRRLSELAILVANRHFSATYAWCRHAVAASRAGLDRAVIDALTEHLQPTFSDPMEEVVYRVSRELLATTGLSETTFVRAREVLGPERLIELVALVGYGCMLSLAVNTFEPDPFPDDCTLVPGGPSPTTYARTTGGLRLAPLQEAALSDRQQRIATQLAGGSPGSVQGAYATWLRTPEIAERALQYEQFLYGNLSVPPSFVELVVLVVARFWTADELWAVHRGRGADTGLGADLIAAIAEHRMPRGASADHALVHACASALFTQGRIHDDTFAQAVSQFGYQAVVELVGVAGFYSMVALTLNAFEALPARDRMTLPRFPRSSARAW